MKNIKYLLPLVFLLLTSCESLKKFATPYGGTTRYDRTGKTVTPSTASKINDYINGKSSSSANVKNSNADVNYSELTRAARKLGFEIGLSDDRRLMSEAATWIGVPYRAGGVDRNGVDCSGLVYCLYSNVYGRRIERCSSADLYEKYCAKLNASQLKQGDLVFFTTDNSGGRIGHSGIYLKDGKFIHASSSKGVIVSSLNEQYWNNHWYAGGKVK